MKWTLVFAVAGLLVVGMLQPARASDPAASLQALLFDDDCEAVPDFPGEWTGTGFFSGTWTIQKLGDCQYRLLGEVRGPEADRQAYDIRVGRLDGNLFFDATSQGIRPDGKEVFSGFDLWIPLHFIGRLEVDRDAVHFRLLDSDWLEDAVKSKGVDSTIFDSFCKASSKELKEFVTLFACDPQAFSFDISFERTPANDAPKKNLQ